MKQRKERIQVNKKFMVKDIYRKIKIDRLFVDKEVIKGLKHNEQRSFTAYTYKSEYVKKHRDSFCECEAILLVPMGTEGNS